MSSNSVKQTIIAGAIADELEPLRKHFDRPDIRFVQTGIGIAAAASKVSSVLAGADITPANTVLIFVGSIGTYDPSIALLSLVSATSVRLADLAVAHETAFWPGPYGTELLATPGFADRLVGAIPGVLAERVACTLAITRDSAVGEQLASMSESRFENLELFGIATACAQRAIRWCSLSCVTNFTSVEGHRQWLENRVEAAERTADALQRAWGQLA